MAVIAQTLPAPVKALAPRKERHEPAFMDDGHALSEQELNHRPGKKHPAPPVLERQILPMLPPAMAGEVLVMMEDLKRNWLTALVLASLVLGSLGFLVRLDYIQSKERFALQNSFQTCLAKLHAWDLDPTRLADLKIDPQRFWGSSDILEMRRQATACQARLEEVKQAMADSGHWPNWELTTAPKATPATTFETMPPAITPTRSLSS